jgi:hypothetical protein
MMKINARYKINGFGGIASGKKGNVIEMLKYGVRFKQRDVRNKSRDGPPNETPSATNYNSLNFAYHISVRKGA